MTVTANRERTRLWPNSLVMIGLFTAHVIIQHRLVSLGVTPVSTDPCDAVNAYAFVAIMFIGIVSILRMLRVRNSLPSLEYLHNIRSSRQFCSPSSLLLRRRLSR